MTHPDAGGQPPPSALPQPSAEDALGARPTTTYRDAGVDVEAAERTVGRIAALARSTLGGAAAGPAIGHFGGVYRLPAGGARLLVASADGIGTKLKLAVALGGEAHARVGADLVNHCLNDVLALGARPLFFLDYVAMGRLDPAVLEALVGGMAAACRESGVALIGGETAEMPGLYAGDDYDAAGFVVGEAAPGALVDGAAIEDGDLLIGLPSGGLQTNGYSLARRVLGLGGEREADRRRLAAPLPGGDGESLGEALMRPHRSFLAIVRPLLDRGLVRGMAHITGGGLPGNLPRMLPSGLAAALDPESWPRPPIFAALARAGGIPPAECWRAFNMGVGFVLAAPPEGAAAALDTLATGPEPAPAATVIGRVVPRGGADQPATRGLLASTADSSQ